MTRDGLASDVPPAMSELGHAAWVFDLDGCLIDSLTGASLRPGARAVLTHLAATGRRLILWSAGGDAYARGRAEDFGLSNLFEARATFAKDRRDPDGWYRIDHLPLDPAGAVFVDDRPEDLHPGLDVMAVSPYLSDDPHDRGLEPVARRAGLPRGRPA